MSSGNKRQVGLPPGITTEIRSKEHWYCTVCTKRNNGLNRDCEVCARPRGHIPDTFLPFHPPYMTYQGAAKFLDRLKIKAYLQAGVDPDSKDSDGWTGLHWAMALSRLDLVDLYLEYGADLNATRDDGWTPLHVACQVGDEAGALLLLHRGADPNAPGAIEGYTPLHVAVREGNKECVEGLGLAGADLNARTLVSKFTPLHIACIRGHYECIVSLILVSGDPLRKAAIRQETALAGLPLDISAKDADGWAPYHLAKLRGYTDINALLDTHGAGVDAKSIDTSSLSITRR
mmetsp:Transcript_2040/g.4127  ORF Transcript_2040/g.4127 Transcript_2040/m.4127 type:complete len:289 (-) Transcript_2040:32-898(-)